MRQQALMDHAAVSRGGPMARRVLPLAVGVGVAVGAVVLWNLESWRWTTPSGVDRPAASAADAQLRGKPAPDVESTQAFDYMLTLRGRQITPELADWLIAVADGHPRVGTRRQAMQCMGWALYVGPDPIWALPASGDVKRKLELRIAAGLSDADATMRISALNAALVAGLLSLPEIAVQLPKLLNDADPHVRAAAAGVAETELPRDNPR